MEQNMINVVKSIQFIIYYYIFISLSIQFNSTTILPLNCVNVNYRIKCTNAVTAIELLERDLCRGDSSNNKTQAPTY